MLVAALGLLRGLPAMQMLIFSIAVAVVPEALLAVVGAALTIVPVLETAKWMERRGRFGTLESL